MTELFSEMAKGEPYVRPEKMVVLQASNRSYPCYWNNEKQQWGGLLEATIFTGEVPVVENATEVSYRQITGIEK